MRKDNFQDLKGSLKAYFNFGKSERLAIVLILVVIIALILLPRLYNSQKSPEALDAAVFSAEIDEFRKEQERIPSLDRSDFDYGNPDRSSVRDRIKPFMFDPNTLDPDGWVRLGFTEKQASGIVKFRDKGGPFVKKEDLKKLYVISDEVYELLEPFIQISNERIPERNTTKTSPTDRFESKYNPTQNKAELNSADSTALVKVYGIGPATAKRIMKYREKLGGFAEIEQLREVYGIDSARYAGISKNVFADASLITKININTASIDGLRKHPYIDYYIAKAIVDKRIKNGAFGSPDDIREIALIYDELFLKLRPYITTDQQ